MAAFRVGTTHAYTIGMSETKTKARYVVIANGKYYTFESRAAARYFAAIHNTTPVRVNR